MGLPWPTVEKEWRAHLKAGDGKARAGSPIRFGKGGQDSENLGLEQLSARARKFARLGGMMRARGQPRGRGDRIRQERSRPAAGPSRSSRASWRASLVELGRNDQAIELATPIAAADDHDAVAAVTLGMAYQAETKWPEAIAAFEQHFA